MFEYTSGNHWGWSVNGSGFAWHDGPTDSFDFKVGSVNPETVSDFRTEVNKTVEEIRSKISDDIFVTFSGGIDGEIICRAFIDCGFKVTPVTFVYDYGINDYEVCFARDFCKKAGLKHVEIKIDIMHFYHKIVNDYCDRYRLPHWICTWKAFLFDSFDGFMIQAQGWPQVVNQDDKLVVREDNQQMNPLVLTGRAGIPDFYRYRPELTFSWLTDPDVIRWSGRMGQPFEALGSEKHFKFFALSKFYMNDNNPLSPREKRSGVELISPYVKSAMRYGEKKYRNNVKSKVWDYDSYLRMITYP